MRFPIKPKQFWNKRFAFLPKIVDGQRIWLETYYSHFNGMAEYVCLPENLDEES